MAKLDGKKVAILVADFFEQVEMTEPRAALEQTGAEVKIVAESRADSAKESRKAGDKFEADIELARAADFDALMIPGGTMNPNALRSTPMALEFTRQFFRKGKPEIGRGRSKIDQPVF